MSETKPFGGGRQQAGLETGDGLVDQTVDRVDDIVYERLEGSAWAVGGREVLTNGV